jgi:Mg2+ and Co2+ transporter CorA
MSSIFILKPIVDRLYEEMEDYNRKVEEYTVRLAKQSQEIVEKNRQIAKLSEECKKLEALLSGYEANFDLLAKKESSPIDMEIPSHPHPQLKVNVPVYEPATTVKSNPTEDVKQPKGGDVKSKKDRRDYMREYQRNYRKKQKEVTLSL